MILEFSSKLDYLFDINKKNIQKSCLTAYVL